jgi:hypothetical protein
MPTTTKKQESPSDYWTKYYGDLVGCKILSFNGMKQDEDGFGDGFPAFTVLFKNGTVREIEISQDPEGNGGGFIFGLSK